MFSPTDLPLSLPTSRANPASAALHFLLFPPTLLPHSLCRLPASQPSGLSSVLPPQRLSLPTLTTGAHSLPSTLLSFPSQHFLPFPNCNHLYLSTHFNGQFPPYKYTNARSTSVKDFVLFTAQYRISNR